MTNPLKNQKGLALITTLLLMALGFVVVGILMRLVHNQSKLTGLQQGYATSLDAAKAGADDFIYTAQLCLYGGTAPCTSPPQGFGTVTGSGTAAGCLSMKLRNATTAWGTNGWNASLCGTALQATDSGITNLTQFPDITAVLGNYTVYVKVVNTYIGPAPQNASQTDPCYSNGCYYFTVVSQAVNTATKQAQAQVQFIYRFPE
ncbi:MAG: hypothetical protein ACP5IL_03410 [Syntrophobacteraceae bacterium]